MVYSQNILVLWEKSTLRKSSAFKKASLQTYRQTRRQTDFLTSWDRPVLTYGQSKKHISSHIAIDPQIDFLRLTVLTYGQSKNDYIANVKKINEDYLSIANDFEEKYKK